MPKGGKRQGAGRKPGSLSAATKQAQATIGELAKAHGPMALSALVDIAAKGSSDAARVSAANALLDRAFGRPTQSHEHTGANGGPIKHDLSGLSDEQLAQLETIFGSNTHARRGSGGNQEKGGQA